MNNPQGSIQMVTEEMTIGHTASEYWQALNTLASIVSERELSIIRGRCLAAVSYCHARELASIEQILATQRGIVSVKYFGREVKGTKKTVTIRADRKTRVKALLEDM